MRETRSKTDTPRRASQDPYEINHQGPGWQGGLRAEVLKPSMDPGRGQPVGFGDRFLPWPAEVLGEMTG
jgi:hypothetical protein